MEEFFHEMKDSAPIIGWIHNISLNQQKYMSLKLKGMNLNHDVRYIMFIYDNPNCSQDDLVKMSGQSKANIAYILKKFEDEGYVKREVNPKNRRKYMLNTTEKGSELVPMIRQISKEWEAEVGLNENDVEFREKLIQIAVNGQRLINENKDDLQ